MRKNKKNEIVTATVHLMARQGVNGTSVRQIATAAGVTEGALYRHFKGNEDEVVDLAHHSETQEPVVVYRALYGEYGLWVRPFDMFFETIERDGKTFKRFEYVGDAI